MMCYTCCEKVGGIIEKPACIDEFETIWGTNMYPVENICVVLSL